MTDNAIDYAAFLVSVFVLYMPFSPGTKGSKTLNWRMGGLVTHN